MNYFKDIDIFSGLSLVDQEQLSSFCQFREVGVSEFLFKQDDEATAMYLILGWKFSVIRDGEEVNVLGMGEIVWEMAFLDSKKMRNASVVCKETWGIVTMIRYAMSEMLEKYPNLHNRIEEIIQERNI